MDNNLTLCEEDCDFNGYNYTTGKAICSCKVKTNSISKIGDIVFDKNKLYVSFTNIKNIPNINVLKCYNLVFNFGNFILIIIIIFLLISFLIIYYKDYYNLKKILNIIVFFKLNLYLLKKFLQRKKREEKIKLNNFKINKNKGKVNLCHKKGIIEDLNLPPPIYSEYLKLHKKNIIDSTNARNLDLFFEYEYINTNSIINNKKVQNFLIIIWKLIIPNLQ